jgi:hypothetical protein
VRGHPRRGRSWVGRQPSASHEARCRRLARSCGRRDGVCSLLSRPPLSSLQRCVHHATATPIFRDTPARRSEKRVAPKLQRHRHHSPNLAADLSCGPHTAKSPIAEPAAPPIPYSSPRFRALALFGRWPSRRVDSLSCRRPKTCTGTDLDTVLAEVTATKRASTPMPSAQR